MIALNPALDRIGALLTEHDIGWAISGGWAIDLFLGRVTRSHADIDIAVWRDEQMILREALAGWQFSVAVSGQRRAWLPDEIIQRPLHELHASSPDDQEVEFLLNERENGQWIYRRDPTIRRPLADLILHNGPLCFLAPEVVLLYKSKAPRATDTDDFHNALPHLSTEARLWLVDALVRTDRAHPWIDALRVATL